jgi:hypothetical protein
MWYVANRWPPETWVSLIRVGCVGAMVYLVCYIALARSEDQQILRRMLQQLRLASARPRLI